MVSPAPPEPAAPAPTTASLYDRLGQKPAIEAVIDRFIGNVVADARISKFFTHLDAAGVAKFRGHLIDQVCAATGGPCTYTGKDMITAHKGMGITDAQFTALVEDLIESLDHFGVKAQEKNELLGALGGMQPDIVGK